MSGFEMPKSIEELDQFIRDEEARISRRRSFMPAVAALAALACGGDSMPDLEREATRARERATTTRTPTGGAPRNVAGPLTDEQVRERAAAAKKALKSRRNGVRKK